MEHVKHRSSFAVVLFALACALTLIFAPTAWAATAITPGEEAEASLDDDGLAEFTLTVDEAGYYLISTSLDVDVWIYDAEGSYVTFGSFYGDDHNPTYLEAGSYTIEAEDMYGWYEGMSVALSVEQFQTKTVALGQTVEIASNTVYLFTPADSAHYDLTVSAAFSSSDEDAYLYASAHLESYDLKDVYASAYVSAESTSDSGMDSSSLTGGETYAVIVSVGDSSLCSATFTITETEVADITQSDGSGSYSATASGTVMVSYTPSASGTYTVELAITGDYSDVDEADAIVWAILYGGSGEYIDDAYTYIYIYEDEDFSDYAAVESDTVTVELTAGETYYFEIIAADYESGDAVSYSLTVTAGEAGCAHDYVATETVAATCTEDGYVVYTCSVCGDTYTDDVVEALGHAYDEGVYTDPTCTEDGYTTYTCANDSSHSYTVTDEGTATGHSYGDAEWVFYYTVSSDGAVTFTRGLATFTCTVCGATYQDVTTDLTVVENEDGSYTVSGTVTGPDGEAVTGTVTDTIEVETGTGTTASADDSEDADADDEEVLASTGDGSPLLAGIAAAGALALAAGLAARRRRNVA